MKYSDFGIRSLHCYWYDSYQNEVADDGEKWFIQKNCKKRPRIG